MSTIQLTDQYTGETVDFIQTTIWYDGVTTMTDNECDGVIYIKHNNLYYKRYIEDHINVKWFGAAGNGVTNDTASIQAAFNFLLNMRDVRVTNNSTFNLCCFIPDGKYKIENMLLFPTACTLKGASKNGTILFTQRNDIAVIFPTDDGTAVNSHAKNKEYTIIADLTIAGNNYNLNPFSWKPQSGSFGKGILIDKTTKISVQNVTIDGFETAGIHCNESYYTFISDTILTNNRIGLLTDASTSVFAVNTEIRVNSLGVLMYNSYASYFTNCLFEGNYAHYLPDINFNRSTENSSSIGVNLKNCHNINFSSCYFEAQLVNVVLYSSYSNAFTNCFFAPPGEEYMTTAPIPSQLVWFYGNNSSNNKFINNYYESSNESLYQSHKFFTHFRNTSTGNVFELTTKEQLDLFISENQDEFTEFINNNWKDNAPKFICTGTNEQFVDAERRYIIDKTFGTTLERPITNRYNGQHYFDSTLGIPIFWQGIKWVKSDGTNA